MSDIETNTTKLKKRNLIPSMTKGKKRWRVTYSSGEQEIWRSSDKVKQIVQNKDVTKIERMKIIVELKGKTKRDFIETNVKDWEDVTSNYL